MKSFGLLRTNSYLTTNVKVVYSDNKLYFESFDANSSLGDQKYKRVIIPEDSYYHQEVSKFWKNTPSDIAFDAKDDEDYDVMYNSYDDQFDDTYISGGSNVKDTSYTEEFEFLAPLHVSKNNIPKDFIIFRVDNPGRINLQNSNFRSQILNKMKVVERFNLRKENKLGKFLDNSFNEANLPTSAIDINFNENEFTYWNGIDYNTGEFTKKGKLMQDEFKKEMTFTQGFDILTKGFKDNELIYPYIINLKFLFDDTPADENKLKKWSINRYLGFYGDLEEVSKITPYKPPKLKTNLRLTSDNIFTLNGVPVDPFERGYKTDRTYYIEYQSDFYLIRRINDITFKVISDIDLPNNVDDNFNLNTITFGENNSISYLNGSDFDLSNTSDVLLIEINRKFHRLFNNGTDWVILSDYKFSVTNNIFRYLINKSDPNFTTVLNLNNIDENNPPITFKIYQLNFSPVKDFDYNFLDTEYSKFEYEFEEEVNKTEEPKLYEDDLSFNGTPKPVEKYVYKNKVESIPTANEYLATSELFEVLENNKAPNKMWRKNIPFVKWGIEGSLSNNDYPYLFNINKKGDDYNRTTNTEELIPNRPSRNLDYFYTVSSNGHNFGYSYSVIHQSLSIVNDNGFEVDKYFDTSSDYFDEFFGRTQSINSVIYNRKKYSNFITGDQVTPNQTVFKGMNVSIYRVDSILTEIINDEKTINSFNVKGTDTFKDYKFSIILSGLNKDPDSDFITINNSSDWKMLTNWSKNKTYYPGDIVIFDGTKFKDSNGQYGFPGYASDTGTGSSSPSSYVYPDGTIEDLVITDNGTTFSVTEISATGPNNGRVQLFQCTSTTSITNPNQTLDDDTNWTSFPPTGYNTIFYQPSREYTAWDSVSGSYSFLIDKSGVNYNYTKFICFYKDEFYKCVIDQTSSDNKTPEYVEISTDDGKRIDYWEKIEEYSTTRNYTSDEIVSLNGDLYYYTNSNQELSLIFSFNAQQGISYELYDIVKFNDNYYVDSVGESTFDNGINIYINKDWKNVLIQIYFNDNIVNPFNINRENLYCAELQQLSAYNFIDTINNITLRNGFINPLKYYVIENGSSTLYELENIEDIPYLIQLESPTEIEFYSHSLNKIPVNINNSLLKVSKKLENNRFSNLSEIDYLSDQPIAIRTQRLDIFNYEDKTDIIYRFNGEYNPVFNDINLFDNISGDRYNFNENLNEFGQIREVVKSKVNENENLLRIEDDSYISIYPQIDEIGYFIDNHNIFKSTWDTNFYKKTKKNR